MAGIRASGSIGALTDGRNHRGDIRILLNNIFSLGLFGNKVFIIPPNLGRNDQAIKFVPGREA